MQITKDEKLLAFRERWNSPEGQSRAAKVIDTLQKGIELNSLGFLSQHEGRWDLRGLYREGVKREIWAEYEGIEIGRLKNQIVIQNTQIENVDFSYSDLAGSFWKRSTLSNARLDYADLSSSHWERCSISSVSLQYADLSHVVFRACTQKSNLFCHAILTYGLLGINIGREAGSFVDVDFSHANLSDIGSTFPIFDKCDFSFTNLKDANFDGARLSNCKFQGKLLMTWFGKHCRSYAKTFWPWQYVFPKCITNTMENVDFSQAELIGVYFDGVDLSRCSLPEDEFHLVIRNQNRVFRKAREIVDSKWEGKDRLDALTLLDRVYLWKTRKSQPIQVVYRYLPMEMVPSRIMDRLFPLLKEIAETI